MVRELLVVQLGNAGLQIGHRFWESVCDEHAIDPTGRFHGTSDLQLERLNVYFTEAAGGKYVPRSILVDLDTQQIDQIRAEPMGMLFRPDNCFKGQGGTGNNWAKGFLTDGLEILDPMLDIVRKEIENCDCFQGIQLCHAVAGGTGAGLGSLLMSYFKDEYPDRVLCTYSVYPSPKVSDTVVEPYNSVLTIEKLLEFSDETFILDNEGIYDVCTRTLKLTKPSYSDLNRLISLVMTGVSSSMRFPGQLNADLRKIQTNMIPFPRLHFLVTGYAPLTARSDQPYRAINIHQLVTQMFDAKNIMANIEPTNGKYLTAAGVFRGRLSTREVDTEMAMVQRSNSRYFAQFIPNNLKTVICDIPPRGAKITSTFIANTTAVQSVFRKILDQYTKMFRRRAFLHWYTGEGMTEDEFLSAEQSANNLVDEYKTYERDDGSISDYSDYS